MTVGARKRFYIRAFLWMGVPFGATMVLVQSLWKAPPEALAHGVVAGVLYGLFMSFFIGGLHLGRSDHVGQPDPNRVRHDAEVDLPMPLGVALEKALAAVRALPNLRRVQGCSPSLVRARTRMTWWSFGERIEVSLTPLGEAATSVRIASRPRLRTTLADYGVNYANVHTIRRALANWTA